MSSIVLADEGARLLVEWRDRVEGGGGGGGAAQGVSVEGERGGRGTHVPIQQHLQSWLRPCYLQINTRLPEENLIQIVSDFRFC